MFQSRRPKTRLGSGFAIAQLIFNQTARAVRETNGNAVLAILLSVARMAVMLLAFYLLFTLLKLRGTAVRGDFFIYMLSGIFMFMLQNMTLSAVASASVGPMTRHAPMTAVVSIMSAALSSLYTQVLAMAVLLFGYHALVTPIEIEHPVQAMGLMLIVWGWGVAMGMVLLAITPWMPDVSVLLRTIIMRVNMVASGKMLLANNLPESRRWMFDWNPLFHAIDQTRGALFLNYEPRTTSMLYPIYATLALAVVGMLGEYYTRQQASASWKAGR